MAWSDAARAAAAEMRKRKAAGQDWRIATQRRKLNSQMRAVSGSIAGNSGKAISARKRLLAPLVKKRDAMLSFLVSKKLPAGVSVEKHSYSGFRTFNGAQQMVTKQGWRVVKNGKVVEHSLTSKNSAEDFARRK